ncbi:MAG: sugar transferase [Bacteroidetes bacterium]|nr:sugar transferase [Bacteroidota bacterium]
MNRTWLIVFGDFLSFAISFVLLIFIRFSAGNYLAAIDLHMVPFLILYLFWVLIFYIFGLYDLVTIKPTIPYLKRWVLAILSSFIVGLLLFYFAPIFGISPKVNLLIQVALFGGFSFLFRRTIYALYAKGITQPAVLVGSSSYLAELAKTIEANPQIGLRVLKHFKNTSEIEKDLINTKNLIIILDKEINESDQSILEFYKKGVEIIDTAKAYEKYLFKIPVAYIDMDFIIENIDINKNILYTSTIFITDRLFAICVLIITSPILLVAVIARLIEDGRPIFIKQKRVGLNNKGFDLYKMRSMVALSPDGSAETTGAVWATGAMDPRITPVGKIIRKLHIDEIPQMINILKGDLALVGPRPERPEFVTPLESKIPHYNLRHIIRPGFTGWAQIKYRYASTVEDSKEKFEYDLYYIKNRNIFIDFGIVLRTIIIIFTH